MSDKSGIEWLISEDGTQGSTWNPIRARNLETGAIGWHCEHCSAGCLNCYAEEINQGFFQLGTKQSYKPQSRKKIEIFLDEKTLEQPLHWRKARRIFSCSMTDAFADFVSDEWLDKMFAVAALCPQHTFLFLTKRSARALRYLSLVSYQERRLAVLDQVCRIGISHKRIGEELNRSGNLWGSFTDEWPLPNVRLGFSAENQKNFDERWEDMSALAAWGWPIWCSAEPLLGPIEVYHALNFSVSCANCGDGQGWIDEPCSCGDGVYSQQPQLSWMVVGGESGPKARAMHPDWARSLRDQCVASEVPFFFKQWGEWLPYDQITTDKQRYACGVEGLAKPPRTYFFDSVKLAFIGKKKAGRLLDGCEWNQMPEVAK